MSFQYSRTFLAATLAGTSIAALAVPVGAAFAQSAPRANFNIPAQDAAAALEEFGRQSGRAVMFDPARLTGARSRAVRGAYAPEDALRRLLAGTGFTARAANANTFVVEGTTTAPGEGEAGGAAADSERARDDASRILVVGSRLGARSPAESAVPIRVITREEIDRSGAGSIAQALSYLPEISVNNVGDTNIGAAGAIAGGTGDPIDATTVQLRGLPAGTTLILINGRRAGESSAFRFSGQFDLSTIPLAMVERIEVLPAGASAIYGGDALAGVVNIVLRRGASGVEVRARHSVTDGHQESEASILWGRSWSNLQVTAGANWRKTGRLTTLERTITADQDFSRFGGRDLRSSSLAYPANVYSFAGCPPAPSLCFLPLTQRGNLPGLNAPFAVVPAGQDGRNLTPADFAATAGTRNLGSVPSNLFSPSESWGGNFRADLQVTSNLELFNEFAFSRRDIPAVVRQFSLTGGSFNVAQARVPANNPFNPFGVDVGVDFYFSETGVLQDFSQTYWRALLGASWRIGRWNLELTAAQSRDRSRVSRAFSAPFPLNATIAALQSTDPATALNPFVGDGSPPWSEQLLQSLLAPSRIALFVSQLRDVTGFARGPLLRLPAGDVLVVAGGEYQRQSASDNNPERPTAGSTLSMAAFAEMRVPILNGSNDSYERLTLTTAWRQEWSDRFDGSADTQTVGFEFRPWQTLMFRGTYSTSYKPVLLNNVLLGPGTTNFFVADPRFPDQFFPVDVVFAGGVPEGLKPETGTSRTLGAIWSPSVNFRASVTWWDNRLRNRFAEPDTDFLIANDALFPGRVVRDPATGFLVSVDVRQINIARTDVSGIDMSVEGRWSTPVGDFIPTIAATYMLEHKEQVAPTLPVQDNLAIWRLTGWSPRWKIVPRLGWDYRNIVYANLAGRYVSDYQDPEPLVTGPNAGQLQRLGDFWLIDLNVELNLGRWLARDSRMLGGTRLSIGVTNLFDRLPDFCNACRLSGYDASQYDIVGRRFHAALRFSF